jgi:hypothetical protein
MSTRSDITQFFASQGQPFFMLFSARSLCDTVRLRQHQLQVFKEEAAKNPPLPPPPSFASFGRSMSVSFFDVDDD